MNSRERLLAASSCKIPDRVPISTYELVGHNSKAWENSDPSYARLMDVIREKSDCICMWEPRPERRTPSGTAFPLVPFMVSAYPVDLEEEKWREGDSLVTRRVAHTPKGDLSQTIKVYDDVQTIWQTEHWCKSADDDGDITLAEVKRRVAGQMAIFGNIQLKLLEHGTLAEVDAAVRDVMDTAKSGGGFIIMPTAAPINTPLAKKTEENYLRFIESAWEYGKY